MKSVFLVLFVLAVALVTIASSQCTCNQCTCSYSGPQECVAPNRCPDINNRTPTGKFQLRGKQSGKCLARDLTLNRYVIRPCGPDSEIFSATAASPAGWFQLGNKSGSCVYTVNYKDDNDTPVHGVACENPATHNWKFTCDPGNQYVQIVGHVGRCMYVRGALVADETQVVLWDCEHAQGVAGHGLWEIVSVP